MLGLDPLDFRQHLIAQCHAGLAMAAGASLARLDRLRLPAHASVRAIIGQSRQYCGQPLLRIGLASELRQPGLDQQ